MNKVLKVQKKGLCVQLAITSCKQMFAPTRSRLWLVCTMYNKISILSEMFRHIWHERLDGKGFWPL